MGSKARELLMAIEAGDIEQSKKLLADGAYDPNSSLNEDGRGADLNEELDFDEVENRDEDELLGHWPLLAAARKGSLEMVKLVMIASGDPMAAARWVADCDEVLGGAVKSRFQNACLEALAGGHGDVAAEMLPHMDWSARAPRASWLSERIIMGVEALVIAARQKRPEMVKLAISGGAAETLSKSDQILILGGAVKEPLQAWAGAAFSNELIDALAPLVSHENLSAVGEELVCVAVDCNANIEVAKIIIDGIGSTWLAGAGDSRRRLNDDDALSRAAREGREDIVEAILRACSEPVARKLCSKVSYAYRSVLHIAAQYCQNIPPILIESSPLRGARGNPMSDSDGNTPIHAAVAAKTPANALAMSVHFDAQAGNHEGNTPLMLLAEKMALTPEWLRVGLDWAKNQSLTKNKSGQTALERAILAGNRDLAVGMARKAEERDMPKIWELIVSENMENTEKGEKGDSLAVRFLSERASADGIDGAIIRQAIKKGDLAFVLAAIEAMEDKSALRSEGRANGKTPLMIAASKGQAPLVEALLPWSNAKEVDRKGRTALMCAMKNKRKKCARLLIPHSDAAMADCEGMTALTHAISSGCEETAKLALSIANVDMINRRLYFSSDTPLSLAVEKGMVELVEIMLSAGARPESGEFFPYPVALHSAVDMGNVAAVRMLLPLSDPKILSIRDRPLIMTAALSRTLGSPENREILELLIPVSDLDCRDKFGEDIMDDMKTRARQMSGSQGVLAEEMPDFFAQRKRALEESRAIEEGLVEAPPNVAPTKPPRL